MGLYKGNHNSWIHCRGFTYIFSRKAIGFDRLAKIFWNEILDKKDVPLDDQTKRTKSSSQPVYLPSAPPLMNPLGLVSWNPLKHFVPVKPFLVHLYLKTQKFRCLTLLVWRDLLFILRMWIKQLCYRKVWEFAMALVASYTDILWARHAIFDCVTSPKNVCVGGYGFRGQKVQELLRNGPQELCAL